MCNFRFASTSKEMLWLACAPFWCGRCLRVDAHQSLMDRHCGNVPVIHPCVAQQTCCSMNSIFVNSTPTNTAHISSCEHAWLKSCKAQDCTSLRHQKKLSSTCHVSFLAAPVHKHKFFLTHLTFLSFLSNSLTYTYKIYDSRTIFTLRSSTAEWRINTNPISHKLHTLHSC